MSEIQKALDMFYTDCAFYPDTAQGIKALVEAPNNCSNWGPDPYLKNMPKDPWGSDFVYENEGGTPVLISLGKDRREGGSGLDADISSADAGK
jgi:general secretion pathway protein G